MIKKHSIFQLVIQTILLSSNYCNYCKQYCIYLRIREEYWFEMDQGYLVFSRWTFRASWKPSSSVPGSSITCVAILRYKRWGFQSTHQCFKVYWSCFAALFVGPDSPGHESDQSCPCLEEEPGAVCVQGEGHADPQQLSGGLLDRKPEEPQPEGAEQPLSTTGESCFTNVFTNKWWNVLQGEEILSQRSQESEDDEEGEAEQRTPLPQDQSEDEVRAFQAFCSLRFLLL